ncbi:MAG TPA: sugar nucleotide-binding protein [Solirubrobacteraceae bacterium]|nr:sugar nucleotide-binding protein [Solirubrobacteraceae bacterium]
MVTGVGGLVGSNVAAVAAQQSWDVLGCYREQAVDVSGVHAVGFDMADRKACVQAAMEFEPDVVVHAAGGVALSRFERDPYLPQVDYVGAEHTLAAARAVRARYVLVSCDWVHSGYRPAGVSFRESDLPDPVNAYGRSKLACEEAAMRSSVPWLITRLGEVYGVNASRPAGPEMWGEESRRARTHAHARHVWEHSGLALRLAKRLRDRAAVPAPAGLWRSPTYAWDYAQRVCELVAQGCEGVYNMGGPVSLGRHDWLELLADGLGCSRALVQEGTKAAYLQACGEDVGLKLPANTALSDEKARAAIGCAAVAPERGVGLMGEQLGRMLEPDVLQAR